MEIKKIGIVGAGQMGSGIAEVAITSGFQVLMRDVNPGAIEKGTNRIISDLERQVQKGKVAGEEKEGALKRLATTTWLEDLRLRLHHRGGHGTGSIEGGDFQNP
jgi:3-hydroxybutyryl-CoA dehydrogenase